MSFAQPLNHCQATALPSARRGVADSIRDTIRLWRRRLRERRAMEFFNDRDLRDIGVSQWEIDREIAKPFWRG